MKKLVMAAIAGVCTLGLVACEQRVDATKPEGTTTTTTTPASTTIMKEKDTTVTPAEPMTTTPTAPATTAPATTAPDTNVNVDTTKPSTDTTTKPQ